MVALPDPCGRWSTGHSVWFQACSPFQLALRADRSFLFYHLQKIHEFELVPGAGGILEIRMGGHGGRKKTWRDSEIRDLFESEFRFLAV